MNSDRTEPPVAAREVPVPPGRLQGVALPWWAKLGAKLALTSAGIPPAALRRLGINKHSFAENDRDKLLTSLADQVRRFQAVTGRAPRGFLELGPARMVARAPIAAALGLGPIFYLDVEDDSPQEMEPYLRAAELARAEGLTPPDLTGATSPREVLERCGARLLIGGPEQLAGVADDSLDLISSTAVLEHVRRDAVPPLFAALRRVMAPDGLQLHAIDLHDHLGGGRVHLRFSARFWEGRAIARSGIYTNRIGTTAWLEAFRTAGLAPEIALALTWPEAMGEAHRDTGHRAQDARFAAIHVEARAAR